MFKLLFLQVSQSEKGALVNIVCEWDTEISLHFLDHFLIKGIGVLKRINPFPYNDPRRLSEH